MIIKVIIILLLTTINSISTPTYMPGFSDYSTTTNLEQLPPTENHLSNINQSGFIEIKWSGRDHTNDLTKLETIRQDEIYKKIPNEIQKGSAPTKIRYLIDLEGKMDEQTTINALDV